MYVRSVQYVASLLFAFLCYFLMARLRFLIIFMFFKYLFCISVFYFVYSVFLYCFVYCFSFCIQLPIYYYVLLSYQSNDHCHLVETQLQ